MRRKFCMCIGLANMFDVPAVKYCLFMIIYCTFLYVRVVRRARVSTHALALALAHTPGSGNWQPNIVAVKLNDATIDDEKRKQPFP